MQRKILLNPGPVTLSERVRNSLLQPDLCHREPEFTDLQNTIRQNLLKIYNLPEDEWAAILLTGSGTAAVEAMLASLIPDTGRILIIENGVYGERMSRISEVYQLPFESLKHTWGTKIDTVKLANCLQQGNFSHVALVHHETTTGRLNDLNEVANICSQHGAKLLLDGVSSFGAESLEFSNWNIIACAATANKCLHSVPGVSFVIVKRGEIENTKTIPKTVYLDLKTYLHQQDNKGTPFTQSVHCFYALDEALKELFEQGGWQYRREQYLKRMQIIHSGMLSIGIKPLLDERDYSCVLHSYQLPENISYQQLHDQLKQHDFIIYAGQGDFAKTIFRVSTMGDITENDMHQFVSVIRNFMENRIKPQN